MSWEEAQIVLDAGKAVTLPENKGMYHLVKKDGQLYEQALNNGTVELEAVLEDVYSKAKERTDWEEIIDEPRENV